MKTNKKINIKKVIIIPIVLALILTSFGLYSMFPDDKDYSSNNNGEKQIDIESMVDDETVLKIIDMHKNINKYNGKSEALKLQFFQFEDGYSVGIDYEFENGEKLLFDIPADFTDISIPEGISDFDWVEVTGEIKSTEEIHDGHVHTIPVMKVKSINKAE